MQVNVGKTEVVVFRHPEFPDGGRAWLWQYNGQPVTRAKEFKYLVGVIVHETEGVSVAVNSLATAARRATWAMISRFRVCKVRDVSLKLRMYKALACVAYAGIMWCHLGPRYACL